MLKWGIFNASVLLMSIGTSLFYFKIEVLIWYLFSGQSLNENLLSLIFQRNYLKQMVRVWKIKSLLFCIRDDPLILFRRQNHVTFIFIKTMSHDLLVQVAYYTLLKERLKSGQNCTEISLWGPLKGWYPELG